MQTVTFQCGHCGKLMGVSSDFLGQQVRCPHCQQVVVAPVQSAPAPTLPPAPAPFFPLPVPVPVPVNLDQTLADDRNEQGSIFAPPPPSTTDLFDSSPAPRLDLPATGPIPVLDLTPTDFSPPVSTLSFVPSQEQPAADPTAAGEAPAFPAPVDNGVPGLPGATTDTPFQEPARVRPPRPTAGNSLSFWILILSLVSYSVLATIYIVYVILVLIPNLTGRGNLLRELPDVDGDKPGGQRKKASWKVDEKLHRLPIPADQRVRLKETLRVGDLEITPKTVEWRPVSVFVEGWPNKPQECNHPSLVLNLRLRNVSSDFCFAPLDNYFDRFYDPQSGDTKPLTCVEVGTRTFYGGPAKWYPLDRNPKKKLNREWVKERKFVEDELNPGAAVDTLVCTDGNDHRVLQALDGYKGPLTWRIHVRRGLVRVQGRDVPATAVIAVQFTAQDIDRQVPDAAE